VLVLFLQFPFFFLTLFATDVRFSVWRLLPPIFSELFTFGAMTLSPPQRVLVAELLQAMNGFSVSFPLSSGFSPFLRPILHERAIGATPGHGVFFA